MQFNVATLLKSPVGEVREYELEGERPVHQGTVQFTRTPDGVLVRASVTVVIDESCSRCLVPFGYPVEVEFEEVFQQQLDPVTGRRLAVLDDAEAPFVIGLDNIVDITEAVRQYSLMAAAMQPLCRPDCPGLCPQCGKDLNLGSCSCEKVAPDPRWAALAALKQAANG